jgi:hypothetical protein
LLRTEVQREQQRRQRTAMLYLSVIATVGFGSCAVRAQEPCAPEVELRRAELVHEGQPGLWFQADVARCLLRDVSELGELRLIRIDLGLRLERTDEYVELLREQLDLAEQATERAQGSLQAAVRGRREAEDALHAWYRSPWLWTAVGAILAGGLVALSAYALNAAAK